MKRKYVKPTMQVAEIEQTRIICNSKITTVSTNGVGLKLGNGTTNGSSGNARSRRLEFWDEDVEDDF